MSHAERIRLDDGAETTLERWGERGPCIVAVHGITGWRRSWRCMGEALADTFRVYAYDQRGHGDSAAVEGPMTLQRSVNDLRNTIAHLPERPLAIVGHSWGGAVVLLGGKADVCDRVVAIDPMIYVEPGNWRRAFLDDIERDLALDPAAREHKLRSQLSAWDPCEIEEKIDAMRMVTTGAIARLGAENHVDSGGWDVRADIAGYPKPLLLLAAGQRSVISSEDLRHVRESGGVNLTVRAFPEHGHNLHRTAFDRFLAELRQFLDGSSAEGVR